MSFWNKLENPGSEPPARPPARPATEDVPPPRPEPEAHVETAPPAPAPREMAAAPADGLRLGPGVRLEGKLTFSGTVRIEATFQGSIITDGTLVVGENGRVDADIACGTVVVEGEVNGNVVAKDAVELRRTARFRGDLESPALTVERGALFHGSSRRPGNGAATSGGKAAASPAPSTH